MRWPDVQALMPLVSVEISSEPDPGYPGAALTDQMVVRFASGGELPGEAIHRARATSTIP